MTHDAAKTVIKVLGNNSERLRGMSSKELWEIVIAVSKAIPTNTVARTCQRLGLQWN